MVKKILTSLATIGLISSSLANVTAWTETVDSQVYKINSSKLQRNGEDAEDIANQLWNKSFGMNYIYWINKDIKQYREQLIDIIVEQGGLRRSKFKYVTWKDSIIKADYKNSGTYIVRKDGAVATGTVWFYFWT